MDVIPIATGRERAERRFLTNSGPPGPLRFNTAYRRSPACNSMLGGPALPLTIDRPCMVSRDHAGHLDTPGDVSVFLFGLAERAG